MREQERRLLVVPEQGLGRTPLRFPKRPPLENPERVPVRYVTFHYSNHVPATLKDEDVQAYYDTHTDDFLV